MLDNFVSYYNNAKITQQYRFEKSIDKETYDLLVTDPLIRNVPIYDVVNRRYAAFSSFPEAIVKKSKDPKGNGKYYEANTVPHDENLATLLYLFRLCGSGINYIPNTGESPWGTHGFGNFWLVDVIRKGYYRRTAWLDHLPESNFCDVKGYMLPMISGGMYNYIKSGAPYDLVDDIWRYINDGGSPREIYEVVEYGNSLLLGMGLKRQNFVLCAFAMDLAEYFPKLVARDSRVLLGTNAKKCFKRIFPGRKSNFKEHNEALRELCDMTGNYSLPYDMEDVMCDFIRYIDNYQSPAHIAANNGIKYENEISTVLCL